MAAYTDGDMQAFQILYARHKGRIFGYLYGKLGDRDEAEEVFQGVFAKLHARRDKYCTEIPFLPWMFTITKHAMIDHVRKNHTYYRRHVALGDDGYDLFPDTQAQVEREKGKLPNMSTLNALQRKVLNLRFEHDFSFDEIANQLHTTAVNARQLASRAIRRLRKSITESGV